MSSYSEVSDILVFVIYRHFAFTILKIIIFILYFIIMCSKFSPFASVNV